MSRNFWCRFTDFYHLLCIVFIYTYMMTPIHEYFVTFWDQQRQHLRKIHVKIKCQISWKCIKLEYIHIYHLNIQCMHMYIICSELRSRSSLLERRQVSASVSSSDYECELLSRGETVINASHVILEGETTVTNSSEETGSHSNQSVRLRHKWISKYIKNWTQINVWIYIFI